MGWRWLDSARRYYNDDTKRFMSRQDVLERVGVSLDDSGDSTRALASLVANGQLSPDDWRDQMQTQIKGEYIRQYMFGRGGRSQMEPSDWGSIGGMLAEQIPFLAEFQIDIEFGLLSEAEIAARSQMYINSAREAFERARASAYQIPFGALPAYPADGQTICLTNDQCSWRFMEVFDDEGNLTGWDCYWVLDPVAEHCDDCIDNAREWNPLFVPNPIIA